ncbi:Hypothetical predicted protein [Podarcis lilfordi]|uniref:Beta-defensin n=1 Tax=Podarcis lilfordi TaxID=74358 RepID=A0AA35K5Z4_9SAUR|nr:Hypothetical predicted protein [Podarcis lilfordi]
MSDGWVGIAMQTSVFLLLLLLLLLHHLISITLAAPGIIQDEKPGCDSLHHNCRVGYCSEDEIPSGGFCFEPVIICCRILPKKYKSSEETQEVAPFEDVLLNLL